LLLPIALVQFYILLYLRIVQILTDETESEDGKSSYGVVRENLGHYE